MGAQPPRAKRVKRLPQANLGGGGIYFRRAFQSQRVPNALPEGVGRIGYGISLALQPGLDVAGLDLLLS